jgi:hypothetical protein
VGQLVVNCMSSRKFMLGGIITGQVAHLDVIQNLLQAVFLLKESRTQDRVIGIPEPSLFDPTPGKGGHQRPTRVDRVFL